MERNIYMDDEFEKFLKEKADQYKLYPSDKAWTNIQRSLRPKRKWPYITLTLLLLLGTSVIVDHRNFNIISRGYSPAAPKIATLPDADKSGSHQLHSADHQLAQSIAIATPNIQMHAFTTATGARPAASKMPVLQLPANNEPVAFSSTTPLDEVNGSVVTATPVEKSSLTKPNAVNNNPKFLIVENKEEPEATNIKKVLWGGEVFKKSKLSWQLSFSPTISYRKLTSGIQDITQVFRGIPNSLDQQSTTVNNSVTQKPAIGAEAGVALTYKLTNNFLLKAGLQLNYSRYQLKALPIKQERATLAVVGSDSITVPSSLMNYGGRGASWFNNEYYQLSMPVGFEWGVLGNSTFKWNLAASAQPVYNFSNNVYLLSTDFKNYAQDPSLVRRWNINAGVETFVSYNMGSFKMQAGPQLRYQLFSSFKNQYPIKEYMVDFGFKIGVTKTLR